MNIEEKFYCSKCLCKIEDENVCPFCGFNVEQYLRENNGKVYLEEGTLLQNRRYQLGAVIGSGGFGITYAAWDLVLDMPVAIKEYYPQKYIDRDTDISDDVVIVEGFKPYFQHGLLTFVREARILAMLQNVKSVVTVYDCFDENQTSYIVMEYVRGKTLYDYYNSGNLSADKLLKMLKPMIDDLILVHHSGVLHRDISPYNLLVQEDGTIKLIDFGAAINFEKGEGNCSLNRSFAAPEQFDPNGKQGGWTDVYALAATVYTLVSGQAMPDALERLEKDTLKTLKKKDTSLKNRQCKAIKEALILDTSKRTQSMEDFRADLYNLFRPLKTRKQKILFGAKVCALILAAECLCLGLVVLDGYLDDIQMTEQMSLAIEAYGRKDLEAALDLANGYRNGTYELPNCFETEEIAVYWYRWSAERGCAEAMHEYAYALHAGEWIEQDIPKAVEYYQKAADMGNSMAMNNLGVIYQEGQLGTVNIELAQEYLIRASALDNTLAMVNLGEIYRQGIGIPVDEEKAFAYYQKAAELGEPKGMFLLGCCYGDGVGVEKNPLMYYKWCYDAALAGDLDAMCRIGRFYINGELGFQDASMGVEWFYKATFVGSADAYYALAILARDGIGLEQDARSASLDMLTAAAMGQEQALEEIEKMMEENYGVFAADAKLHEEIQRKIDEVKGMIERKNECK